KNWREAGLGCGQNKSRRQTKRSVLSERRWLRTVEGIVRGSRPGDLASRSRESVNPFTAAGFGNWFRDRCNEAGLPQCSAHGLRKAGASVAAENGATVHELMAIFGWLTMKEAERYTQAAQRKKLARNAAQLLVRPANETSPQNDVGLPRKS